ncbi:Uncharacterized protein TCAP_01685 [Tolypocladium capitatum]|uniref:Uncharacterized protein n=1 Tax=Tolypocladium capitatum TaxID=45235 RepID=A0A2K3QLI6_9HYPO|nr:Uncharacterized protein TCAP_01685 [Tolypocladium capitatum]
MNERPRHPEHGAPRARGTGTVIGVRPNLFRSQLTRRPTASSSNLVETVPLDVDVLSDTSEIVVRDEQGEIELGDPPTPVLEGRAEQAEDRQETEKERQRLAEAVKHHTISHSSVPDQPEELLEAVRAGLRAKVIALAEDNWMFEPEEQARG